MAAVYTTLAEAKKQCNVDTDFTDDDTYIADLQELVEELVLTDIQGSSTGKGTVATTAAIAVVGTDTNFLDFNVGDTITVRDETLGTTVTRTIATITSDTALTVTAAFVLVASDLTYTILSGIPTPIPKRLKQAMLLILDHFYTVREPILIGVSCMKIPYGYEYLIAPWKHYTIA